MICLRCDNEEFLLTQDAVIEQEFKGEQFEIHMPAFVCSKCGWVTVDLKQADELRKRTADAYRKKHGLLTSDEIKTLRKLLRINQREFAKLVGVGEASIKRWETWLVQEKSSDELIRLKCERKLSEQHAQKLTTPAWVSFEYDKLIQSNNGITIQITPPTTVTLFGAEVHDEIECIPEKAQMSLCEVVNRDVYGPSPPRFEAAAVSFSMLSMNIFKSKASKNKSLRNLFENKLCRHRFRFHRCSLKNTGLPA